MRCTLRPSESHWTRGALVYVAVSSRVLNRVSLAAILLLTTLNAHANDLLRLYNVALTGDAVLAGATYQRDAATESIPRARAGLLPQVSVTGSAGRERLQYESRTNPGVLPQNCSFPVRLQLVGCYGFGHGYDLTLTQPLWNSESYNRLKEAGFQSAAAEATLASARQSLVLRLAEAYFAILSALDRLASSQAARDAFGSVLNQAKARELIGASPASEVAQAQSYFDSTQQAIIDAQNALDDSRLALSEVVGSSEVSIAPLQEKIPMMPPDPASVETWVLQALQDNPAVHAASLLAQATERDIAVQKGKRLPNLSVSVGSSRLWQDPSLGGNYNLDSVGVSIEWPLFQGGALASAVRQSEAEHRAAVARYDLLKRETERQTRSAYRNVVSGIARINAARRAVDSGHEALEASHHGVEFGNGSQFELLSAENTYYASLQEYQQTRYDYLLSSLQLKLQAGQLSDADLAAVDKLLVPQEREPTSP